MGKKILVTGGAGFIGSHTVDALVERGDTIRVYDNLTEQVHGANAVRPSYLHPDVEFIKGDVRDRDSLKKAIAGMETIIHDAAEVGVGQSMYAIDKYISTNVQGTGILWDILVNEKHSVEKVLIASSMSLYGEGKYECAEHGVQYPAPRSLEQLSKREWEIKCPVCHQDMKPLPVDELRVNPHNQYAVSKYCQELYALTLGRRFGIPTVVLRYSITQGPRQSFYHAYSGILRLFTIRLLSNFPAIIYEDGEQLRDYVYVGDVARANLLVMEDEAANFEVFNIGGDRAMTVLEYAELFSRAVGKDTEPEIRGEFRFGDSRHIISDISKLKKLGWQPEIPVEQIIKEYLDWVQTQPGVADYYAEAERVMKQEGVIKLAKCNEP
ncbi:MAG: SDR family NAD(P)-dependent oxidoreductase [Nitrospinae bacterium]|nr:SDR family NAD(P)-dependent oxidoreductase [Nitrospinota bacterium]